MLTAADERLIVFRTDASRDVGTGHLIRCLTLAEAVRASGGNAMFVSNRLETGLASRVRNQGFDLVELGLPEHGPNAAAALSDAEATEQVLDRLPTSPDWLVVDHYGLDEAWERRVRTRVERILVIDDLADRAHDCDLLLDQNLVADMATRYRGRVPAKTALLLGPRYALLNQTYAELHALARPRGGALKRIVVFFGGGDNFALVERTIAAFRALRRSDLDLDVVVGRTDVPAAIGAAASGSPNVTLHTVFPTLAPLLNSADLAIGAGGTTSWERLCLGLPSLVVTVADNQRAITAELQRRELVRWLGDAEDVTIALLHDALHRVIEEGLDPAWSERCLGVVDGHGARRVVAAMSIRGNEALQVRQVREADKAMLLSWSNDPVTRANGFSPKEITADEHERWFTKRLSNPRECRMFVIETTRGVPIGQVRFEREPESWSVHYALAPEARGRGLGRRMLQHALAAFQEAAPGTPVVGEVLPHNVASCHIFESLGFAKEIRGDRVVFSTQPERPRERREPTS